MERNRFLYRCLALLLLLYCFGVGEMKGGCDDWRYNKDRTSEMFYAQDVNGHKIRYYIVDKEHKIVHVVNKAESYDAGKHSDHEDYAYVGNIVIPENVTNGDITYEVQGVWCLNNSHGAFDQCKNLKSVCLPKTIKFVYVAGMFCYCTSLKYVVINSDIMPFYDNKEVAKYPKELTSGNSWVYADDNGKKVNFTYYVNSSVESSGHMIGDNWIHWNNGGTYANWKRFADGELDVAVFNYSFSSSGTTATITGLKDGSATKLKIPAYTLNGDGVLYNVTAIGDNAFKENTNITSVDFSKATNLTSIGSKAFYSCSKLSGGIVIPSSVTSIISSAFQGCTSLQKLDLSKATKLQTIGNNAFDGCISLSGGIVIPSSVTSIGELAFYKIIKVDSLIFPSGNSGDLNIGSKPFYSYDSDTTKVISKIRIGRNITGWSGTGSNEFIFQKGIDTLILEGDFKTIGAKAFKNRKIEYLKIDANITNWGAYSFCNTDNGGKSDKYGVKKLEFGDGFNSNSTFIGEYAFQYNRRMEGTIDLSKATKLTTIKNRAFDMHNDAPQSRIKSISLPPSIDTMEVNAFFGIKCDSVKIQDLSAWCKIDFETDQHSNPLNTGIASLYVDTSANRSGKYVCQDKEMVLPYSVENIKQYAFYGYKKLKKIVLPNKLGSIGKYAFYACEGLDTVIWLGTKNASYGSNVFNTSGTGKKILIARDTIQAVQKLNNSGLKKSFPIVPNTIEYGDKVDNVLHDTIFYRKLGSGKLQAIAFPDTIKKLERRYWGESAVEGGYGKTTAGMRTAISENLVILSGFSAVDANFTVTSIGDTVFKNVKQLKSVEFGKTPDSIGAGAFAGDSSIQKLDVPNYNDWASKVKMKDSASNPVYCCDSVPDFCVSGKKKNALSFDVNAIGDFTFYNLRSLKSIVFGKKLDTIGKGAFWDCNLSSTKSRGSISNRKDSLDLDLVSMNITPPKLDKEAFSINFADSAITSTSSDDSLKQKNYRLRNNIICYVPNEKAQSNYFSTEWKNHFYIRDYAGNTISYPYGDAVKKNDIGRGPAGIEGNSFQKNLYFDRVTEPLNGKNGTCRLVARIDPWDTTATGNCIGYLAEHNFVRWNDSEKKITDTATWNGSMTTPKNKGGIVIPNNVTVTEDGVSKTFNVVGIGNSAFANCLDLDTIKLNDVDADTTFSILNNAFDSCANLKHINIPEKTLALGDFSFKDCLKLDSIDFHKLRTIGEYAFINCPLNRKDTLIIGDSIRNIELAAFANSKIKHLLIKKPKDSISLREGVFYNNDSLRSVTIKTGDNRGENPVKLYRYAFWDCDTLKTLSLGNNVSLAEEGIFYMCKSLDSVAFPKYATKIGDYAFDSCTSLKVVIVNDTLENIGIEAFTNCYNIEKVVIPDLSKWCSKVTYGKYSSPLTEGGYYQYCKKEKGETKRTTDKPTLLYLKGNDKPVLHLVVPEDVKKINERAFEQYQELKSITFHNQMESVGTYAFRGARGLDSVLCFGKNPFELGENVFLYNVEKSNGKNLSVDTSHAKLYVRDRVAKHHYESNRDWKSAFSFFDIHDSKVEDTAKSIKNIHDTLKNMVFEYDSIFYGIMDTTTATAKCKVHRKCKAFEDKEGKYRDTIVLPEIAIDSTKGNNKVYTLTCVGDSAFYGCNGLYSLSMPENVDSVAVGAFRDCHKLKTIVAWAVNPPVLGATCYDIFTNILDAEQKKGIDTLYVRDNWSKKLYEHNSTYRDWGTHFVMGTDSRVVSLSPAYIYYKGIYYNKRANSDTLLDVTRDVTRNDIKHYAKTYAGKISIPDTFTYDDGVHYTVKGIEGKSFYTRPITTLSIPFNVDTIGAEACKNCSSLDSVIYWGYPTPALDTAVFTGIKSDGKLYVLNRTFKKKFSNSAWKSYFEPNDTRIIPMGDFHFIKNGVCYRITPEESKEVYVVKPLTYDFYANSVNVPEKVTNDIPVYKMTDEDITYDVVGLADSSFAKSTTLKSVYLPKTITHWGDENGNGACFSGIKLDTISSMVLSPDVTQASPTRMFDSVPHKVLVLQDTVSLFWYADKLKWMTSKNVSPYFTKSLYFDTCIIKDRCAMENGGIYYNFNGRPTYGTHEDSTLKVIKDPNGSLYSGNVDIPNQIVRSGNEIYTVTKVDKYAFSNCTGLTAITLRDSINEVRDSAFYACSENTLKNLYLQTPNRWASITFGNEFSNPMRYTHKFEILGAKRNTTELELSVPSINKYAFEGCSSMNRLVISPSVTKIGSFAFDGCTGLKEVYCMHKDLNTIPDLLGLSSVFSDNLKGNGAKLYAIKDIWGSGKKWEDYFDIYNAVYIYYGENGNQIVPHSDIKVSSNDGKILVKGAKSVAIIDLSGSVIEEHSCDEETDFSCGVSQGLYLVRAESDKESICQGILVQ